MEAVIFIGLQGAGKSTFYRERFLATHAHISLDLVKTRRRERQLLQSCIEARGLFVVDNTNPSHADRQVYIGAARLAGYRVVGYYFRSRVEDCWRRNDERTLEKRVPFKAILGTASRLEVPSPAEGFDELHYVWIDENHGFRVEDWRDEDR